MKSFKSIVEVIDHPWGNIFADACLTKHEKEKDTEEEIEGITEEEYAKTVREWMTMGGLLNQANGRKCGELTESIRS